MDDLTKFILQRSKVKEVESDNVKHAFRTKLTPLGRAAEYLAGAAAASQVRETMQLAVRRPDDEDIRRLHELNKLKLGWFRERMQWRKEHPELAHEPRSSLFIQECRAIQAKTSNSNIHQALKRERKRRLKRAQRIAEGLAEGHVDMEWPDDSWQCSQCEAWNFPKEEKCNGTRKGVRCTGVRPGAVVPFDALPPVRKDRACHKTPEQRRALRARYHANKLAKVDQRVEKEGSWFCPRCKADNQLRREKCRKCSHAPDWSTTEWTGDWEAVQDAPDADLGHVSVRRRNAKRGGAKHRKKKRAVRTRAGPVSRLLYGVRTGPRLKGKGRRPTKGEKASVGKAKSSGSGAMRHPIAHWKAAIRSVAAAGAALTGYEAYQFLHAVRQETERAVVAVTDLVVHTGRAAEDTIAILTVLAEHAEMLIGAGTDALLKAAPYAACIFLGAIGCWLGEYSSRIAGSYGYRGQRVGESKVPAPGEGSGKEDPDASRVVALLHREEVRQAVAYARDGAIEEFVRNGAGAEELFRTGRVRTTSRGEYVVGSLTGSGMEYKVRIQRRPGKIEGLGSLGMSCQCKDFLLHGGGCKHIGSVLWLIRQIGRAHV